MAEGRWDDSWQPVVDEFDEGFRSRGETGASLCINHEGRTVVDVWGGTFGNAKILQGEPSAVLSSGRVIRLCS